MLVPVNLIAQRQARSEIDVWEDIDDAKCPYKGERVYYQYLPMPMQQALLIPPDSVFSSYPQEERNLAFRRQQLLLDWHEYLFERTLVDSKLLWNRYCEELSHIAFLARGGKVPDWPTAKLWWKKYLEFGLAGLCQSSAGKAKKGSTTLSVEQQQLIIAILYHPDPTVRRPHLSTRVVQEYLKAETGHAPARSVVESWLKNWQSENKRLVDTLINPDKARGSWSTKIGSLSEDVVRLNQRWELDGTKLDIMCNDDKRYTIAVIIDIYSRRAKCMVTKTSTSASLSLLARECINDWGIPEEIVCDNGKDYISDAMTGFWKQLGVKMIVLPPFYPAGKPHVESFNRTLALRAELWPGFVGHSVADRKGIESRLAFSARMAGSAVIRTGYSMEEAQEAVNSWLSDEYHEKKHSSLGMSPREKADQYIGEIRRIPDIRALDILLEPIAGTRVYRNGYISLDGGKYVPDPPEAMPQVGAQVAIRRGADYGIVYLYNLDGEFICKAVDNNRLGADRTAVAIKIKQRANEQQQQAMKELRATAKAASARDVNEAIAEAAKKKRLAREADASQSKVVAHNFRQRSVGHTTEALQEAEKIVRVEEATKPTAIDSNMIDDPAIVFTPPSLKNGDYQPLYDAWRELDKIRKSGKPLCDNALAFYANFQTTAYFKIKKMKAA